MRVYDQTLEEHAPDEELETEIQYLVRKVWGPQGTARFAQARRVHPKTARRWVNGRNEVPEDVLVYLRDQFERVDPYLDDVLELAEDIVSESGLDPDVVAGLFRRVSVKLCKAAPGYEEYAARVARSDDVAS